MEAEIDEYPFYIEELPGLYSAGKKGLRLPVNQLNLYRALSFPLF
jgi:hypothetical protein